MNGHRAKKVKKLARGATVAGAYRAAKQWWVWLHPNARGHVTRLVKSGELVALGAGWRTAFRTPTPGAPPPAPKRKRPRSGAQKRHHRSLQSFEGRGFEHGF